MCAKPKSPKRLTGGSAAERGLDFQARVSAVVIAHLLSERSIGWLDGVLDDTPTELQAETGGPGDDIRFLTTDGKQVELQAKRGLQRGDHLWEALISLSTGISKSKIDAGVLAVCPNSSGTIREDLAEDIVRLGAGRTDGLREIGKAWADMLRSSSLDAALICSKLRVVVVSAIDGNREAEGTAEERLSRIVRDPGAAWPVLVEYGRSLIRRRGRSLPEDIYRVLALANVKVNSAEVETRIQLIVAVRRWLCQTYVNMNILGVRCDIPFDSCWIGLDAQAVDDTSADPEDLDKALSRYHEYGHGRRNGPCFDSPTLARFVRKCVVVGGPGMGKSTLLKKLALEYSSDGFLTLLVRLPQVVALLVREGRRFEDCLVDVALSGSGLRTSVISLDGAVILCDALDECGSQQPLVTEKLHAFSVAHPRARVVVTTRPIGYRPGELATWRQYELQPLNDNAAEQAVTTVLEAIPFADMEQRSNARDRAIAHLKAKTIKGAAARSPLMITLVAALSAKGIEPGLGKAALYRKLFQLLQDHPPARLTERPPSEPERNKFLELLGWCLLSHGSEPSEQTLSRCARWWNEETGQSFFASETKVLECLYYWECLGVVERVRTQTQEAITFVHKTFGEFAAASYISKCKAEAQRKIIAIAIGTPSWKETLSFASHLGLVSPILQVWAELTGSGDAKAANTLDDAVELVIQSGAPLAMDALASFVRCCWDVVDNTSSRVRYVAGEALCLVAQDHWGAVRDETFARLDSTDKWSRLVAWACLCVGPEQDLAASTLAATLSTLVGSRPSGSYLDGFSIRPTGGPVWKYLVLGAARRILTASPEPHALSALRELIGDVEQLDVGTIGQLEPLFEGAGLDWIELKRADWSKSFARLMNDREAWNREAAYLLELIDDPAVPTDNAVAAKPCESLELGGWMTAISYWETPVGDDPSLTRSSKVDASRRKILHALAQCAGIDHVELVRQGRSMRAKFLESSKNERFGLSDLPNVDAEPLLEEPLVDSEFMNELEDLIVGPSHLFALNATKILYSMRNSPEYPHRVKSLLARGRGESLRLSAALAVDLTDGTGQRLILDRLIHGESTSGCRYLYKSLTPPFGADHLEAVRKGLSGTAANAAAAAAELINKFSLDRPFLDEIRTFFEQWRTKEPPYPIGGGVVPESPRDELAKVLIPALAHDHDQLLTFLNDARLNVQSVARANVLIEAKSSAALRSRLLKAVQGDLLEPSVIRAAVSSGLYREDEALEVAHLLHHASARVRFAALPILTANYLSPEHVRDEANRLLTDEELDIREGASRALHAVGPRAVESRNP